MRAPLVTWVTDTRVVSAEETLARVERLASIDPALARRCAVQLRDPELSTRDLVALGRALRERTRALGMRLVVNDRVDVALLLEADGLHLGRRSIAMADARGLLGEGAWVSVACHAPSEVVAAAREGASACLLSPIFATPGKGAPLGVEALGEARRALDGAGLGAGLIALGGIDDEHARACLEAGADGVAAIRAALDVARLAARAAP